MPTRTPSRQRNRRTSKRDKFSKKDERPAFVPRYIALQFLAIKGIKDVKPVQNTPSQIDIILTVDQPYNHGLQMKILQVESDIKQALRSRRQKFEASISW